MEIRHQVWWFSSRTSFSRPWWRLVRETPWWMVGEWIAVIVIHWSQLAEYTYPIMNWLLFSIDYFFGLIIAFTVIVCTLCYWLLFLFMLSSLSSVSCQKGLQAFFFLIAGHRRFVPAFIDSEGMLIWMPGRTTHHFFYVFLTSRETMGCPIYQSLFVFIWPGVLWYMQIVISTFDLYSQSQHGFWIGDYPLVNVYITMENHYIL